MDVESFRKAGHEAIDRICDYYQSISQRPVMAQVEPGFLRKSIPDEAPEHGEDWAKISDDYQNIILPGITHWQHPNFFAYFPANATFEGALADLYSASITNPGFNWSVSPSNTELELITLNWMAKLFGLSDDFLTTSKNGGGIILGTASEVAITVAVAAREKALSYIENSPLSDGSSATSKETDVPITETTLDPDAAIVSAKESHGQSTSQQAAKASIDQAAEDIAAWRGRATSKLVMYGTTQTHSIGAKAALVLGLNFRAIEVFAKDAYALRGDLLEAALKEDTAKGLVPFLLIATVGSTSSGAIDNLGEIQSIAKQYPTLWVHVDAAWAGVAYSLPEYRELGQLESLNAYVDSFSTNMHKWGLVPFDCAPLWVRDRSALSNALTVTPEFLRTKHGDAGSVLDLRNMQLFLGRRFRSLKVWFVLRSYGQQGFRSHLRNSISLSQQFNELIAKGSVPFELAAPPRWALTTFRLHPKKDNASLSFDQLDDLNRRFWNQIEKKGKRLVLTQTVLPEIGFCIRMAVGSPQTKAEHITEAYQVLCECAQEVL